MSESDGLISEIVSLKLSRKIVSAFQFFHGLFLNHFNDWSLVRLRPEAPSIGPSGIDWVV